MKKSHILIALAFMFGMTGCFDLDKSPEAVLSTSTAFKSTSEIQKYLNQFYESAYRGHPMGTESSGIGRGDDASDNMLPNAINTRLAGMTSLSNASQLGQYNNIRNVNFLILNLDNCEETGAAMDQCIGEAYYFRAWYYYQLLINYGGVTWVEELLDPVQEQMERPRDSRTFIADKILADLDIAIEHLQPQSNSASMRVHKDVARILKSEVALFEGTWEKYHKTKNTPFFDPSVTDEKIKKYLTQAADAAYGVINDGRWSIYKGDPLTCYRDMFITLDLSSNPEVLWWKKYNAVDNIGHSMTRYLNKGGGRTGASASLVDDYLTIDGRPFIGSEKDEAKKIYGTELQPTLRDPRLSQVICTPGQPLRPNDGYVFQYPPLDGESYHQNTTGYSILKYVEFNTTYAATVDGEYKSQAPAIQFRYADALLNYAEALAELDGAGNAVKIQEALRPLRERVGMPAVDFDREYNADPSYPFRDLDKYIQCVRRERRVEKAFEGCRLQDILRWAAADVLIHGVIPTGALLIGSDLENNPFYKDSQSNYSLKYDQTSGNNVYLTGKPGDAKRYIVPFDPSPYPNGWQFNLNRDYLLPIQERMLALTGNQWVQNPGW